MSSPVTSRSTAGRGASRGGRGRGGVPLVPGRLRRLGLSRSAMPSPNRRVRIALARSANEYATRASEPSATVRPEQISSASQLRTRATKCLAVTRISPLACRTSSAISMSENGADEFGMLLRYLVQGTGCDPGRGGHSSLVAR